MFNDFFKPNPSKRSIKFRSGNGTLFRKVRGIYIPLFYVFSSCFVLSIIYLLYLYAPLLSSVISFWSNNNSKLEQFDYSNAEDKTYTKANIFRLIVPRIEASATIEPGVNPYNKTEYTSVLTEDKVALSKFSGEPGDGNGTNLYIFAHSTEQGLSMVRHNSTFYLLGELKNGDEVYISKDGKNYKYEVYDQKIVKANQTEYLTYSDPNNEVLILQTCWPIGTDWNRLLIFAKKVEN